MNGQIELKKMNLDKLKCKMNLDKLKCKESINYG
jgi:hypothetical protein